MTEDTDVSLAKWPNSFMVEFNPELRLPKILKNSVIDLENTASLAEMEHFTQGG